MWTLDATKRRRYVHGMTRLGVWYVRNLLERGEIRPDQLSWALCKRVDLYRLTDVWKETQNTDDGLADAEWMALVTQIAGWVRSTPWDQVETLEERVLALLEPSLEARLPKDVGPPPVRPFACWTYELGWPGLADRPGLWGRLSNPVHVKALLRGAIGLRPGSSPDAVLHIMNVLTPESPLNDLPRLAATLQALIAELQAMHSTVQQLWCNTWLNDHVKFQRLFPESWLQSAKISPPGNYRNWWGQFARRDGDFNEAAARQFRDSNGTFHYRALQCHASVRDVQKHLESSFGPPLASSSRQ